MLGGSAVAIAGTGLLVFGILALLRHRFTRNRRLCAVAGALEQRISLQFLLDEGRKVEIGQLQQLDRLHQLRRHHQRLRLAEL